MKQDLRSFLDLLEARGRLLRLGEAVSPNLEATEIHRRVLAGGGPAILLERPVRADGRPYAYPMLVNLFGTVERVAWALGKEPDALRDLGQFLAAMREPDLSRPLAQWSKTRHMMSHLLAMRAKVVRSGACQEVVRVGDDVDLNDFPIQTCWPGEPAPVITWPLVVTVGPNRGHDPTDDFNLGIYRMQVLGRNTTAMRWLRHRGGAQQSRRWERQRRAPMPAAAVIGAWPLMMVAAVTPVPDTLSEYRFAGLLGGERVQLVRCKTIPLMVPAHSEIVLEGHVHLDETVDEGPYGDHTGYYNSVERFPVFRVSAITHRKNPLYTSTYTGRPPDEPSVLGVALNELLVPLVVQQIPEVADIYLPPEACSYRMAVVSVRKSYPGQAKRVMMAVWTLLRQFLYTKWVVVVDEGVDVRNWEDVVWRLSTHVDPKRDITILDNTPIDYLDFASPEEGLGGKIGIDATTKIPPETKRDWGKPLGMSLEVVERVDLFWPKVEKMISDLPPRKP